MQINGKERSTTRTYKWRNVAIGFDCFKNDPALLSAFLLFFTTDTSADVTDVARHISTIVDAS